jgi:hypothetical protein
MSAPLGGGVGGPGALTINAKYVDGGPPWEVMTEIWERASSMQETSMASPLGGDVGDPGVPTINAKNVDSKPLSPCGGSGLHPGSKRCVVNLYGMKDKR